MLYGGLAIEARYDWFQLTSWLRLYLREELIDNQGWNLTVFCGGREAHVDGNGISIFPKICP